MAKVMVKCPICGERFDRNDPNIEWEKQGRRYVHKACLVQQEENLSEEERDKKQLYDYIGQLFDNNYNYVKVSKQVDTYHDKNGYTYSGIYKTLYYFFDIRKESIEKANGGIGIVPYVYEEARDYWYRLFLAQQQAANTELPKQEVEVVEIESPRPRVLPPKFIEI